MATLKLSTAYTRMFLLVQSSDHITGLTGASPTVTLSKAGGAFGALGGSVTEVSSGWYKISLNTTDTGTLGDLAYHITATSGDPTDFADQVTANILGDTLPANMTQVNAHNVTDTASGVLDVNAKNLGGTAQTGRDVGASVLLSAGTGTGQLDFTSGVVKANATQWLGGTIPAVNVTGVPLVDAKYLLGTIFATPATAGIIDANVKNMNNVAATSITTINANQGTTQPLNFTGTAGSALVKSDMVDVAGAAVSTSSAQIGVNAVNIAGQAAALDANNRLKVDVDDWGGTAVGSVPIDTIFIRSGTAQAGGASTITLDAGASATDNIYKNETVFIRSGTGAGQANIIASYVGSTKVATMANAWITNPDSTSVFTLAAFGPMGTVAANLTQVNGHAVTDTASGVLDVNAKNHGGTAQTGRDIGASVLLSAGTGTGQLDFTSGVVKANATQWLGGTIPAVNVTGVPLVDLKYTLGTISPAAAGSVGIDWAQVANKTSTVGLTGTTVGTVTTVTNQLTAAQIATGVWQDATAGDFTVASSIGKSLYTGNNVPGAANGLFIAGSNAATTVNFTGNLSGSVGSVTGAVGSVTGAVGSLTTNNDKTGYALTSGERTSIADAALDRDMSVGTDSGSTTVRTMRQALRFLRNKWVVSGTTLTVYKEDDATSSWSGTVTATPGADPITASDPAGP